MARGLKRQFKKSEVAKSKPKCKRCNRFVKPANLSVKELDDWVRFRLCPRCVSL